MLINLYLVYLTSISSQKCLIMLVLEPNFCTHYCASSVIIFLKDKAFYLQFDATHIKLYCSKKQPNAQTLIAFLQKNDLQVCNHDFTSCTTCTRCISMLYMTSGYLSFKFFFLVTLDNNSCHRWIATSTSFEGRGYSQ